MGFTKSIDEGPDPAFLDNSVAKRRVGGSRVPGGPHHPWSRSLPI